MDDGADPAVSSPFQGALYVSAGSAVTADEGLLFHEDGPDIQADLASSGRPATDDRSTAGKAVKRLLQNFSTDVLDDDIDPALLRNFADFSRPGVAIGIQDMIRAQRFGEGALGFSRAGGNHVRANLPGDLNGVGTDPAGPRDDQNPIGRANFSAIGEHVHGGAAGEGHGSGGGVVEFLWDLNQGAGGDDYLLRETTVQIDPEKLPVEADGFLSTQTKFATPAKKIGLDSDALADSPIVNVLAQEKDLPGDFGAKNPGELDRNWKCAFLSPEIEPVQAAGFHGHDDFIWFRPEIGQRGELQLAG
jgi:hypothetical protein